MKTKMVIALLIGTTVFSCSSSKSENIDVMNVVTGNNKGTGSMENRTYNFGFDKIKVSTSIDAEVRKSNEEKIVLSAPSDIIDKIVIEKEGDWVKIGVKSNSRISTKNVRVIIYANKISAISATSSGDILIKDKFTQEKMTINVTSSGDIKGNLEANEFMINASSSGDFSGNIWAVNLNATASSSGDISVSGKVKNANLTASSSGDIKATGLVVQNATIKASSSGDVYVGVSDFAKATASSGGVVNIYKKGNLQVERSSSSGGKVNIK